MQSHLFDHAELLVRVLTATALGAVIGYERDLHAKAAGLRTHSLVALASATFMVVSTHFVYFQSYKAGDLVDVDSSRIAASVVSGIGFLAGGAILRTGFSVQGLTTAAGLWLVSAIGLAAGGGMYLVALFSTAVGVFGLTLMRRLEEKHVLRRRMSIVIEGGVEGVGRVIDELKRLGVSPSDIDYESHVRERRTTVSLDIRLSANADARFVVSAVEGQAGVERVRLGSSS